MSISVLLKSLAIALLLSATAGAQFPALPPDNVTSVQDRDQILWQLGIVPPTLPPKLQDPNRPLNAHPASASSPEGNWTDAAGHIMTRSMFGLWNNYDDANVGVYTALDLLKAKDGKIVSTPGKWWSQRRPEILKDAQEQVWGVVRPAAVLPAVEWSVTTTTGADGGSGYKEKTILGSIDTFRFPQVRNAPKISAVLRIPAEAKGPVPVIVVFGGPISSYWNYVSKRGWGVCTLNTSALQPDNGAALTSYLIGLVNQGNWRKPTDWGSMAAWGWGLGKLIDYFEIDPDLDASKIGIAGHSRYGKAALVAMAYEPRVAIAFPSCAGSLGTKLNKRHWGQDLENSGSDREYHWVAGNFFKWMGPMTQGTYLPRKVELMPVDTPSLLALCAPRPVFISAGTADSWSDPYGEYLAALGAAPVYSLLGKQGLLADPKPQADVSYAGGDVGYRLHNGGHTDAPDWPAFLEFAAKYFDNKQALDVTAEAEITPPSYAIDKRKRVYSGTVKITNLSVYRLRAPLTFVALHLVDGVALANASGRTSDGYPFLTLPGELKPGESVTIQLRLASASGRTAPSFTAALYSGAQ